jgi:hypothetical protein
LIILSFEGGRVLPYYFFTEEEAKTPFLTGFFYIKKRLPFSGEPYRLSKPIAGILRSKSRMNRNVL